MTEQRSLWGAETEKAVANSPISGEPIPRRIVHWLAHIKSAAASVNAELGVLDSDLATMIVRAADEGAGGDHDRQFGVSDEVLGRTLDPRRNAAGESSGR